MTEGREREPSYLCGRAAWRPTHPRSAWALFTVAHCSSWSPFLTKNDHRKYSLPLTIDSSMKMPVYPFSKYPFMQSDFAAHRPDQWSSEWPFSGWINTPFSDIIVFVREKGQVMVGPYVARACCVLSKSICEWWKALWLNSDSDRFNFRKVIDSWRNDANIIKLINVLSSGFL